MNLGLDFYIIIIIRSIKGSSSIEYKSIHLAKLIPWRF